MSNGSRRFAGYEFVECVEPRRVANCVTLRYVASYRGRERATTNVIGWLASDRDHDRVNDAVFVARVREQVGEMHPC